MNKNTILSIATLVVVVVVLVFSILSMTNVSAPATASGSKTQDTIAVYGQGKISLQPDVAYITLGVRTLNEDAQIAQENNAVQMDAVIGALTSAGIDGSDIQTVSYNVYQQYDYSEGEEKPRGYEVTNIVQVTITDVDRAGEIISITASAGANRFAGIRFDVIARQEAYIEAMDMALARALQKAEQLAKSTGRKIEGVISVQESGAASPVYSSLTNFVSDSAAFAEQSSASISSGQLEISAIVNVVYRLK